jgi:N-acetylneuraminate 9-O-acetyltransferase
MRRYSSSEISSCLANRRALFVGDSSVREVFWAVARMLDPAVDADSGEKHIDMAVSKDGTTLQFIWDPFLNSSALALELASFSDATPARDRDSAALILISSGLWYARHESVNGLKKWKDSIDEVVQHMREGRSSTHLAGSDLLLLAPVLTPAYDLLTDDRRETITPGKIGAMNTYLKQLSFYQGVDVFWAFDEMLKPLPHAYESSGIRIKPALAEKQADALLNLRCNSQTSKVYPFDNTCCNNYQAPNYVQWMWLVLVLVILPAVVYMRHKSMLQPCLLSL